jgi:hypothetical protein
VAGVLGLRGLGSENHDVSIFRHIYCAIRRGEWEVGWERWPGCGWLNASALYYDGYYAGARIGWLYISVSY